MRVIKQMRDILDKKIIEEKTGGIITCEIYDELDSTNNRMKEYIYSGRRDMDLIVADSQTMGRGRLGRTFDSPSGHGIYMSILIRRDVGSENVLLITSAAAVAVVRAIRKLTGADAMIKWVNDIYIDNRKVCGILAEAVSCGGNGMDVVLGIGINVTSSNDMFSEDVRDIAGSLYGSDKCGTDKVSRNEIIAGVANELNGILGNIEKREFIGDYRRYSLVIGKEIKFLKGDSWTTGKAVDIDDDGGLIVDTCDGRILLNTGEITLRLR